MRRKFGKTMKFTRTKHALSLRLYVGLPWNKFALNRGRSVCAVRLIDERG